MAALFCLACVGCAQGSEGRRRARWFGRVGAGVVVAGGATWVVGQAQDSEAAAASGAAIAVIGAAMMITAGIILARAVDCEADADCPEGQACREVPAAAGRLPYAQCVPR